MEMKDLAFPVLAVTAAAIWLVLTIQCDYWRSKAKEARKEADEWRSEIAEARQERDDAKCEAIRLAEEPVRARLASALGEAVGLRVDLSHAREALEKANREQAQAELAQAELARAKEWESSLAVALAKEKTERQQAQAALLEAAAQLEKAREAYQGMREAWRRSEGEAEQARGVIRRLLEPARDALGLPSGEEKA